MTCVTPWARGLPSAAMLAYDGALRAHTEPPAPMTPEPGPPAQPPAPDVVPPEIQDPQPVESPVPVREPPTMPPPML